MIRFNIELFACVRVHCLSQRLFRYKEYRGRRRRIIGYACFALSIGKSPPPPSPHQDQIVALYGAPSSLSTIWNAKILTDIFKDTLNEFSDYACHAVKTYQDGEDTVARYYRATLLTVGKLEALDVVKHVEARLLVKHTINIAMGVVRIHGCRGGNREIYQYDPRRDLIIGDSPALHMVHGYELVYLRYSISPMDVCMEHHGLFRLRRNVRFQSIVGLFDLDSNAAAFVADDALPPRGAARKMIERLLEILHSFRLHSWRVHQCLLQV